MPWLCNSIIQHLFKNAFSPFLWLCLHDAVGHRPWLRLSGKSRLKFINLDWKTKSQALCVFGDLERPPAIVENKCWRRSSAWHLGNILFLSINFNPPAFNLPTFVSQTESLALTLEILLKVSLHGINVKLTAKYGLAKLCQIASA